MRKFLDWLDRQLDKFIDTGIPMTWDTPLFGECDTCGDRYDVSSRENRCGDCGDCGHCCLHVVCQECGEPIYTDGQKAGCPVCKARIINVTFQGFAGTYFDQPEPAEGLIWCPLCQDETDASFDFTHAYCLTGDHEVEIDYVDEDPDDAYERAWERRRGLSY
jgi:hypothetical protein